MKKVMLVLAGLVLLPASAARGAYEMPDRGPETGAFLADDESPLWSMWIRAYAGHDNNVQEIAETTLFDGDRESFFLGMTLEAAYRAYEQRGWTVGLFFRFDQSYYLDDRQGPASGGRYTDDADDFNLTVLNPSIVIARRLDGGAVPVTVRLVWDVRYEDAQTGIGGVFHTLELGLSAEISEATTIDLAYQHGWDDFDVAFVNNALNGRDATRDKVEISATQRFNGDRSRAKVGYAVLSNDSDGRNFNYDGYELSARIESLLGGPFVGAVEFIYGNRDYDGFISGFITPPGRTEMDLYTVLYELLFRINDDWTSDAFYRYTSYQSNHPAFDSSRSIVGMGLRRDF